MRLSCNRANASNGTCPQIGVEDTAPIRINYCRIHRELDIELVETKYEVPAIERAGI